LISLDHNKIQKRSTKSKSRKDYYYISPIKFVINFEKKKSSIVNVPMRFKINKLYIIFDCKTSDQIFEQNVNDLKFRNYSQPKMKTQLKEILLIG
jgi:hypothetical protein